MHIEKTGVIITMIDAISLGAGGNASVSIRTQIGDIVLQQQSFDLAAEKVAPILAANPGSDLSRRDDLDKAVLTLLIVEGIVEGEVKAK